MSEFVMPCPVCGFEMSEVRPSHLCVQSDGTVIRLELKVTRLPERKALIERLSRQLGKSPMYGELSDEQLRQLERLFQGSGWQCSHITSGEQIASGNSKEKNHD